MQRLRLLLAARPGAMAWLVACMLAMRVLVPAGYMPVATSGGVVLGLCPGTMPAMPAAHAAMSGMHHGGMHHGGEDQRDEVPAGAAMPCAFAGAGAAALDVPLVVIGLLALAFGPPARRRIALTRPAAPLLRWRPPLRAPPAA